MNNEQNRERRNKYPKNKRETDVNFRLISNTRNRIYKSLKGLTKHSSCRDILGKHFNHYKKWIEFEFTPEMNWSNFEIDNMKPTCMFNVSDGEELKLAFNWKKTQPLLKQDHQYEGTKFIFVDYQLQFVNAYQIIRLNEEGFNENIH